MGSKNYITTYKGKPLYLVNYEEYIMLYKTHLLEKDGMYIIADRDNVLIDNNGLVIGRTLDGHRRLRPVDGIKKSWKEVLGYIEKVVISERPTIEALKTEGEKKLEAVVNETKTIVGNLNNVGEKVMEQTAKAGEAALAEQVKNTEAVVKKATNRRLPRNRRNKGEN